MNKHSIKINLIFVTSLFAVTQTYAMLTILVRQSSSNGFALNRIRNRNPISVQRTIPKVEINQQAGPWQVASNNRFSIIDRSTQCPSHKHTFRPFLDKYEKKSERYDCKEQKIIKQLIKEGDYETLEMYYIKIQRKQRNRE